MILTNVCIIYKLSIYAREFDSLRNTGKLPFIVGFLNISLKDIFFWIHTRHTE